MCESAGRQVILILSKPGFLHYFLMHFAYRRSNKYQLYNLWFEPISDEFIFQATYDNEKKSLIVVYSNK